MAIVGLSTPNISPMESTEPDNGDVRPALTTVIYCLLLGILLGLATFVFVAALISDETTQQSPRTTHSANSDSSTTSRRISPSATTPGSDTTHRTAQPPMTEGVTTRPTIASTPGGIDVATYFINSSVNWSNAPCKDFFNFVCGNYKDSESILDELDQRTGEAVKGMLKSIDIPSAGQSPTEKAAGLFRACTRLGSNSSNSEVHLLKGFLSRLGLDFSNMAHDPHYDILERIASLAFEFGIPAFVQFGLFQSLPEVFERTLGMHFNKKEDVDWIRQRHRQSRTALASFYQDLLRDYDGNLKVAPITDRIVAAERIEHWVRIVMHYTNKTFKAVDAVLLFDNAPALVGLLMDNARLDRQDSRLLLAGTLLRRLLPLTHGKWMLLLGSSGWLGDSIDAEEFCYTTVSNIMEMAATQRYFKRFSPPRAVSSARRVVNDIRNTLLHKLSNTSWIKDPVRSVVLEKANNMHIHVAYPKEYANDTLVDAFYSNFPDVGADFFTPYIASRRQVTIRIFRGQVNANFTPIAANALYDHVDNKVVIQAGILQPPVFIEDAPGAINYASLGQIAGHEMMHGYDIYGIAHDERLRLLDFNMTPTMMQYSEKVLCLRASYKRAEVRSRARTTDHDTDSEGFADYTGLLLAHTAFKSLPRKEREAILPGISLSANQLFYVAHCRKFCTPPSAPRRRYLGDVYWAQRSRCIVPLQNIPDFATDFQCKPGDLMNPQQRCFFW